MIVEPTLADLAATSTKDLSACQKTIVKETTELFKAIDEVSCACSPQQLEEGIAKIYLELADIEFQLKIIEGLPEDCRQPFGRDANVLRQQIAFDARKSICIDWDLAKEAGRLKYRERLSRGKNKQKELEIFLTYCKEKEINLASQFVES